MPTKKDWTGYKFNTFVVLKEDLGHTKECEEKIKNGELKRYNKKWLCQCECGNIISVSSTQIAKNRPYSCGCKEILTAKDLSGQQFGEWTVLYRDVKLEKEKRKAGLCQHDRWICQCSCGEIKSVMGTHLRSGASTCCGHIKAEHRKHRRPKDVSGARFGKLIALECLNEITSEGYLWRCVCDCGEERVVPLHKLTEKLIVACESCSKKESSERKSMVQYRTNQRKIAEQGSLFDVLTQKYPNLNIDEIWCKENKYRPQELTKKSHYFFKIKCPNCGEVFETCALQLYNRVYDIMCPSCLSLRTDSSYETEVKRFLNEELHLVTLHESKCTLRVINPITKGRMFFDNEIPEYKLLIEVHGDQHYSEIKDSDFWLGNKTSKQFLEELQWRDRYKKKYAIVHGYKYIALGWWQILNGTYKDIIKMMIGVK